MASLSYTYVNSREILMEFFEYLRKPVGSDAVVGAYGYVAGHKAGDIHGLLL